MCVANIKNNIEIYRKASQEGGITSTFILCAFSCVNDNNVQVYVLELRMFAL